MREFNLAGSVWLFHIIYMRSPSWASNPKKHCRLNSEIQCDFIIRVTFELQREFLTHVSVIWWLHETAILMMIGAVKA